MQKVFVKKIDDHDDSDHDDSDHDDNENDDSDHEARFGVSRYDLSDIHSNIDLNTLQFINLNNWIGSGMRFLVLAINAYLLYTTISIIMTNMPIIMTNVPMPINSYLDEASIVNLQFCEMPFAITPFMAQGASALAHLPYVPAFLLGVSYVSPDTIPTLNSKYAFEINKLLWTQFALQTFTSIGHMIPNPRVVLAQEISIIITFYFLFAFLELTTPKKSKFLFKWKAFALFTSIFMFGYFVIGLMPVIFTGFITIVILGYAIQDAFGLITRRGRFILLSTFVPTAIILFVETTSCGWLQANISATAPWHLLFDIMFWQVVGSAIDVILISPRPGAFLMIDE
jgi:hypothetical protein